MYHSAIKHLLRIDTVPYVLFRSVAVFVVFILFDTSKYVQIRTRNVTVRLCHITDGPTASRHKCNKYFNVKDFIRRYQSVTNIINPYVKVTIVAIFRRKKKKKKSIYQNLIKLVFSLI